MKHNKIRNTGLIFEILSRLLMRETMDNNTTAYRIVRKHFKPGSELVKELKLYQSLGQPTSHNPTELLELSIQAHANLDKKRLFAEKYDLIRSVKKNYNPKTYVWTSSTHSNSTYVPVQRTTPTNFPSREFSM